MEAASSPPAPYWGPRISNLFLGPRMSLMCMMVNSSNCVDSRNFLDNRPSYHAVPGFTLSIWQKSVCRFISCRIFSEDTQCIQ